MLAPVVAVVLVISWIIATIRRNNNSGLKEIPNAHFLVPYTKLWLLSLKWRKIENRTRVQLHRDLGPVVRLGPCDVSVNCIDEGVRTIYSSKFDKDASFYHALFDQTGFMVTMVGNDEHRRRKRMLSWPYSNSYILKSQTLDSVLARVTSRLREGSARWASTGVSVDVYQQAKCCTLDVASGWLFGSENGTDTLREPEFENDLTTLATAALKRLSVRTSHIWPMTSIASWINGMPAADTTSRWESWLTRVITNAYRTHSTKHSSDKSLYDYFFDSFKSANPDMPNNEVASYIAVECDDHLSASHIGLGTTLSYTMYELSRKPEYQRALRKELLALAAEPSNESMTLRLAGLPVLDAVVTETLRTRAPCPGPFPRVVPDSGCQLVGRYNIPPGTIVSSSAWALHFNPVPFPFPDEWRPQRWLEADEKTNAEMRRWIWTFGSGARVCIGTHYSMRVVKELLATIYTDYETSLDEEFTGLVDQEDAFSAGPLADSLKLKFRRVSSPNVSVV